MFQNINFLREIHKLLAQPIWQPCPRFGQPPLVANPGSAPVNVHFNAAFTHLHQALYPFLHLHLICTEKPLAVMVSIILCPLTLKNLCVAIQNWV